MSELVWSTTLAAIPDVDLWNRNLPELKRLADNYGPECKKYIAGEALRRGYMWSSVSKCYVHPWKMLACAHPGCLIGVGFRSGQLAVIFTSPHGAMRYESVAFDVGPETAEKLVRSLYPDNLYSQIVKGKIEMVKV